MNGSGRVALVAVVVWCVLASQGLSQNPGSAKDDLAARRRAMEDRAQRAEAALADESGVEVKLSGSDVVVETLPSGEIIIYGNEQDLDVLEQFANMLDRQPPDKAFEFVTLEKVSADQVAEKLQTIAEDIWPNMADIPDQQVKIFAVSSSTILISAPDSRMDRMIQLARTIDEVETGLPDFEAMKFVIQYRKAAEVAEQLTPIIERLQAKQQAGDSEKIDVDVNDADNSIMIFGPPTIRDQVQRLIDQIDVEPTSDFSQVKLVMFPLLNAVADDLAGVLTDMLATDSGQADVQETIRRLSIVKRETDGSMTELAPLDLDKPIRILADHGTNSLILATIEENIAPLSSIIELLDSYPTGHDMLVRIFPLKFADAETVKEMLKTMFDEGKKLPERAPGGGSTEAVPESEFGEAMMYNVGLVVDKRTNTLVVSGREAQMALAELVVAELDVPVSSVKFPLRLMFLGEHVDATRVGAIVEELFDKRIELLEETEAGVLAIAQEKVYLAVDLRSNALIVSASETNYAEIERITQQLNVASNRLIENVRILHCDVTSAADLASKIDELWQRKANLQQGDAPQDLPIIVADQRSNSMVIASSPEDFKEIEELVAKLEAQPLSPIAGIRFITLVNNDASQTSDMLKSLFEERMEQRLASGQEANPTDRVAVAVDAATNTILVASSQENFDEMSRIVAAIDIEPIVEGVVRLFVLQQAEASDVADKIKELMDQGLYSPQAGLDNPIAEERNKVAIIADPRINAIIVSASKSNLSIVEMLVERMDGEISPLLSDDTKIIRLEYADAVKLAEMLGQLFDDRQSESAEPDLFRKPTLLADERSNMLILSGAPDAMNRCQELITQLDKPSGTPSSTFEVYTLVHGSAVRLATKMQELFDKRAEGRDESATPINIQADEASNSLIASASRDDHTMIQGLLALLDRPSSIAKQFQIFPLARAKVDQVAETLDQLFQQQAEGGSGSAAAIAVQADARSNSLVVWASRSEMDNIAAIVQRLDTAEPTVEMMMKVVRLEQALAEDFAQVFLETLFSGETGGGDDQSAVIVSFVDHDENGEEIVRRLLRQDITITPDPRTNALMVMAPADSMEMLEAMIMDFDRVKPVTAEIRIFPLANADAEEMIDKLNEVFGTDEQSGDGMEQRISFGGEGGAGGAGGAGGEGGSSRTPLRFTADRRTNSVIAAGNLIDLRMAEDLIRELDGQEIENRVHEVYHTRFVESPAVADAIQQFSEAENDLLSELDDEVSIRRRADKQINVVSDEDTNALLIGTSSRQYDNVMDLIRRLDRPEPQVMISVLIAEVSMDDRMELGVEFAGQDLNFSEHAVIGNNGTVQGGGFDIVAGTDIGAAGAGFGGISLTVSGEDFSFLFRALESQSELEVLSRPTLLVQNNAEGSITIGDRVPIVSGSTSAGGQSSTTVQYEDVGIILDVTPHINPDGYVNLEISPEISQISNQSLQISEGLNATVFSERSAETTVTVKDGETVILGGLITENVDESVNKVPILGDLPLIGKLFRSEARIRTKTELLIVLTVNVLRTEDDLHEMSLDELERTGNLPDSIKRSPLMQGLRILPEDDKFGPVRETEPARRGKPLPRNRSIYGPMPRTYGPPRPTAAAGTGAATGQAVGPEPDFDPHLPLSASTRVYGPRLVRSEP